MARIKLIVTGDMEKLALHKSLQQFFPDEREGEAVLWDTPRRINGATSYRLKPLPATQKPSMQMLELAKGMIAEAVNGRTGEPADLVVVIDDVELGNLGQENVVAEHFRAAVNEAIKLRQHDANTEARVRQVLRKKCSFHLLKPMVESYLFGDTNALGIAGVPAGVSPKLTHPTDVEQFEINDHAWLPACRLENEKKAQEGKPWWHHECHPKHYLEHLAQRGDRNYTYEETQHGKEALWALDWQKVPKDPTNIPIFGSLFEDLADWFGIQNPVQCATHPAFYPTKTTNRANLLLRNM